MHFLVRCNGDRSICSAISWSSDIFRALSCGMYRNCLVGCLAPCLVGCLVEGNVLAHVLVDCLVESDVLAGFLVECYLVDILVDVSVVGSNFD